MAKSNDWGGKRPNAGRKQKRLVLKLDERAAKNLFLLTKLRRSTLDKPDLTEEEVVADLVEQEWKSVQRGYEPKEVAGEPYIL